MDNPRAEGPNGGEIPNGHDLPARLEEDTPFVHAGREIQGSESRS